MKKNKRVEKLEASLTFDQIIMRWLDARFKFNSHEEFARWVAEKPRERRAVAMLVNDLEPPAKCKPGESERERKKRLQDASEYLCIAYQLIEGAQRAVEQPSPCSEIWFGLTYAIDHLADASVASLQPFVWFPLPVLREVAETIRTALHDYVMPRRDFVLEITSWFSNYCTEMSVDGTSIVADQRRKKLEEFYSVLHGVGALNTFSWIKLEPFPYRSLGDAALVDDRWLDCRLLELGEFAALLVARGFRLDNPPDSHPLEPLLIMNAAGRMASEQELLPVRREAKDRLRLFKGRINTIRGNQYIDINDYRRWADRAIVGELTPELGIGVASFNNLMASVGGEEPAEIAGVKLSRLRAPFSSSDFVSCENETDFANRSAIRSLVQLNLEGKSAGSEAVNWNWTLLRQGISCTLKAQLASRGLVKLIEKLFNGHPVLFRHTAKLHDSLTSGMEGVAAVFNEMCPIYAASLGAPEVGPALTPIDLNAIRAEAKTAAEITLLSLKDNARIGALKMLGRNEDALGFGSATVAKNLASISNAAKGPIQPIASPTKADSIFDNFKISRSRDGDQRLSRNVD